MTETTAARSRNMAAIRAKDTGPEKLLRSAIFARGFRFRIHVRGLPGSPDLVFPKFKAAVFVHGCFWHRHIGCRFTTMPKSNAAFWAKKFSTNQQRDITARKRLHDLGWRIGVVWECAIRRSPDAAAAALATWLLAGGSPDTDIGADLLA